MSDKLKAVIGGQVWHGRFVADDEELPFLVIGATFAEAVANIDPDMPGEVIGLVRGEYWPEREIELGDAVSDAIRAHSKKVLN
jgi:hypothetical protein